MLKTMKIIEIIKFLFSANHTPGIYPHAHTPLSLSTKSPCAPSPHSVCTPAQCVSVLRTSAQILCLKLLRLAIWSNSAKIPHQTYDRDSRVNVYTSYLQIR